MTLQRKSPSFSRLQPRIALIAQRIASLGFACTVLTIAVGCGGSSANPSVHAASQVFVAVSPIRATVTPNAQQQFLATVKGTSNTAVMWSASAGSITSNGTFTAPPLSNGLPITVKATSLADSSQHSSSLVTILGPSSLAIATSAVSEAQVNTAYSASLSATGGTPPYQWTISAGALAPGIQLNTSTGALEGITSQQGAYSFTTKVVDVAANSATQSLTLSVTGGTSGNFDGPAELPRIYLKTTLADTPAPGATITVNAGGDLQSALDSVNCGDIIQLQSGATFFSGGSYGGAFTLPAKACDDQHWIIIRTNTADANLPPEGTRMTPCYAGVASLPGRPSFGCITARRVLATISYSGTGDGPFIFANGANHYRLLGLEITRTANDGMSMTALISPQISGAMSQIVLDRLYIHGTATDETRRGVELSGGTSVAVQDSYISDLHCAQGGNCTDSQAVSGGTGDLPMGPFKITDNFLEAAGENIIFGGGEATLTPADIEISRNHFFKPLTWMQGQPGFIGMTMIVKNHLEFKNAQRVLVDSNIMENDWGGFSQYGDSVLITPKNQDSKGTNVCPICQVTDVTIRYLTISHVAQAFQIANILSPAGGPAMDGERYSIHDVIADDIDGITYNGHGTFAQVSTIADPLLQNVQINHVTAFPPHTLFNVGGPNTVKMPGFVFTNSIVTSGQYSVWSTGSDGSANCAYYDVPLTTMNLCFSGYVFSPNAILGSPYPSSSWPTGNIFYTTSTIGFVNYNNGNGGDYHLLSSSPAKAKASDGGDLGANVDTVLSAVSGIQ